MGKHVRYALHPLKTLSDNNFGSDINSVMRKVQLQDNTSLWGRRNIILSDYARILEGFPLNSESPTFDSVIRNPVYYTIDRAQRSARIDIPGLLRGVNYFPQNGHALFRVIVTLGVVPDMMYDAVSREYQPAKWFDADYFPTEVTTSWCPSLEGMPATTLELGVKETPPDNGWSLMLSIGIQYGSLSEGGEIKEVKRFGAAKIVALRGRGNTTDGLETIDEEQRSEPAEAPAPEVLETKTQVNESPTVAMPDNEVSVATVKSETQIQTFCYDYVSASASAAQPAAAVYTYTYAVTEAGSETPKSTTKESKRRPSPSVQARKMKTSTGNATAVERWGMTKAPLYGEVRSTVATLSSRYVLSGQWRL